MRIVVYGLRPSPTQFPASIPDKHLCVLYQVCDARGVYVVAFLKIGLLINVLLLISQEINISTISF